MTSPTNRTDEVKPFVKHSIDHIHKVERCIRLERRVEFLQARVNRSQKDAWHDKGEATALRFALDCVYTCYPDLEQQVQEAAGKHLQWYESVAIRQTPTRGER